MSIFGIAWEGFVKKDTWKRRHRRETIMEYDLEYGRALKEIRKRNARKVLVQLPEGLKQYANEITKKLSKSGARIILSADPCFGACDIKEPFDLTIHYGHTQMLPTKKTLYIPCYSNKNVVPAVRKAEKLLPEKVGIVTTAQHLHKVPEVVEYLGKRGHYTLINGTGQVLGCDASNATKIRERVDAFLFVGSGYFHPQMVSYATGKKVVRADPYTGEAEPVEQNWERERYLRITKAMRARTFGIVVGEKPGQKHMHGAIALGGKLKNTSIILLDLISPETIDYLPFDAFVITACPRIVLDDWKNYRKPILLPDEAEEMQKMLDA